MLRRYLFTPLKTWRFITTSDKLRSCLQSNSIRDWTVSASCEGESTVARRKNKYIYVKQDCRDTDCAGKCLCTRFLAHTQKKKYFVISHHRHRSYCAIHSLAKQFRNQPLRLEVESIRQDYNMKQDD